MASLIPAKGSLHSLGLLGSSHSPIWRLLRCGGEGYLISGVNELDSFVGNGENDGWHLLHLFCRLLGTHIKKNTKAKTGNSDLGGIVGLRLTFRYRFNMNPTLIQSGDEGPNGQRS